MAEILFVDDDDMLREANVQTLELAGLAVRAFPNAQAALNQIKPEFTGAVVTDIRMPGMDGLQFFARIRAIDPEVPVILITGHGDVPMAVRALQDGAFDFLAKPFAAGHLAAAAAKALNARALVLDNRRLRADAERRFGSPLIGDSPAIVRLRETIVQVARADIDVLVEGETGTGKELVAAMLHRGSPRSARGFVAVACAALPEAQADIELFGHAADAVANGRFARTGRIEQSNRGTLFLDDVDALPINVQSRLCRVLEEREVLPIGEAQPVPLDLRVIASAKPGLEALIDAGHFRRDLFFRLNIVRLSLPPLRERREDIAPLFAAFVQEATAQIGQADFRMTDPVRRWLIEHDWPGNVRELRNFAFRAALNIEDNIICPSPDAGLAERTRAYEEMLLREALAQSGGSVARTMKLLKVPRKTLYDKMNRAAIVPADYRQPKR